MPGGSRGEPILIAGNGTGLEPMTAIGSGTKPLSSTISQVSLNTSSHVDSWLELYQDNSSLFFEAMIAMVLAAAIVFFIRRKRK